MADEGDGARLVWMLVGPATNDMEPEEICTVALKAARTLYDAEQADIGLTVWAWFLWRTGLGAARRFVVPGLVLCAIFLSTFPQWKPALEKWLREYFEDEGPGEKLRRFWTSLRK